MTASNRSTARSNPAAAAQAAGTLGQSVPAQAAVSEKAKSIIALFTRPHAKTQAALFLTVSEHPRAPVFGGHLGGVKVSVFLRHPLDATKPPFLSFVGSDDAQIATGNVRIRDDGIPLIKAVMADKSEVWINVSKNVSDDMLERLGANMNRLHNPVVKADKEAVAA